MLLSSLLESLIAWVARMLAGVPESGNHQSTAEFLRITATHASDAARINFFDNEGGTLESGGEDRVVLVFMKAASQPARNGP